MTEPMADTTHSPLYQRLSRLRIQAPLLALALVLAHQIFEHTLIADLPRWQHFTTQVLFYGLVGPALAWLALTSLRRSVGETLEAEREAQRAHEQLVRANRRLRFLIDVTHKLAEAEDEQMLLDIILQLPAQVLPTAGATLVRFAETDRPLPALHTGEMEPQEYAEWIDHLSKEDTANTCSCSSTDATRPCPQLARRPESPVQSVVSLPLERGGRTHGLLIAYLTEPDRPSAEEHEMLKAMAGEVSLALESHRLRSRELEAIYRLQQVSRLSDLHSELGGILSGTVEALEVDGGALLLRDAAGEELRVVAQSGRKLGESMRAVLALIGSVESPMLIGDLALKRADGPRSLLFAPVHGPSLAANGALLLWDGAPNAFGRRHLRLAELIAGQQALLVENYELYMRAEHKAALEERARLAREIHDGLAQVLGYLKLRAHQLQRWSQGGRAQEVSNGLYELADLLSSAYADAREAIDNLRISPEGADLVQLQRVVLEEFEESSGIRVTAEPPPAQVFSPEATSQLLRILQEALANVRKHAQASGLQIGWQRSGDWVTLRVVDDGRGFSPEEVPAQARHGLQTMRERCELLGGEFQIRSRPLEGTELTFRVPVHETEAQHF